MPRSVIVFCWGAMQVLLVCASSGCGPLAAKRSSGEPSGTILADPNPIRVCDDSGLGKTRIAWFREGFGKVEVRVESAAGSLLAEGGSYGSTDTGKWVQQGTKFVLIEAESNRVLASVATSVTSEGCPETPTSSAELH